MLRKLIVEGMSDIGKAAHPLEYSAKNEAPPTLAREATISSTKSSHPARADRDGLLFDY